MQSRIRGFVHDLHAAAAEFFHDTVVRDGFADDRGDAQLSGRFTLRTRQRPLNECMDLSGISETGSRRLADKRKSIWFVGHTEAMG
jgi:hypothetical protein